MSKNTHLTGWTLSLLCLGLAAGLGGMRTGLAADGDQPLSPDDETKVAADEDAQEKADRGKGIRGEKYQRVFHGTFLLPTDTSQQANKDVVGTFITDESDPHPGQTYMVKVDGGSKETLDALTRCDTKKIQVQGKLRVNSKYLIVKGVVQDGATPKVPSHVRPGGV